MLIQELRNEMLDSFYRENFSTGYIMRLKRALQVFFISVTLLCAGLPSPVRSNASTYYVSSSTGNDNNNGLSEGSAFATSDKVNTLDLQPGDHVLFKCGDTWQAQQLVVSWSGTPSAPIEFGSYPAGCANKPVFSGSLPITGWILESGNIYRADLPVGNFPLGINQLFRSGQRLTLGRWPNLDAPGGGYSFVEAHSAGSNQITDHELPAFNWNGAIVHIKNIRWSMLDRQVTGTNGDTLVLNQGLSCLISSWGDCTSWGFFINNALATLDQDGEWFYDEAANQVYLYSTQGVPSNIEGSVVQDTAGSSQYGGVMLSDGSATAYVILENLEIKNWFNNGISTPGGMNADIYHDITVNNVTVKDVDGAGVKLSSWLERPSNGRKGLRGGYNMLFTNDTIDGANDFGITGYFADSTFEGVTIENIALIKNLGKSGMGCGLTTGECTENGDGFRIRTYDVLDSGYGNTLRNNRFEKIGYNGVDVFGPETTLEQNFITQACFTKADCGGVRVFGGDSLATTDVHDIHLIDNIIYDIPGNVDGCQASRAAFGMGLYVDNYSRDVETRGNTVISTTVTGILYQRSTGQILDNTVYNASSGTEYSAQISLAGSETRASLSGNVMYGLTPNAWTLYAYSLNNILSSDHNYFFQPYVDRHIAYGPSWTRQTFTQWQGLSGQDVHSKTNWFTQPAGEATRAKVFYNAGGTAQTFSLGGRQYLDLDQNPLIQDITLLPFTSKILVDDGPALLSLHSITPALMSLAGAADFTLTANGSGFTANSVIRWNGASLPTAFVSSTRLTGAVTAAQVSSLGMYSITVWDPQPAPTGSQTPPVFFRVVANLYKLDLPLTLR
jgi:hypothetical protein